MKRRHRPIPDYKARRLAREYAAAFDLRMKQIASAVVALHSVPRVQLVDQADPAAVPPSWH